MSKATHDIDIERQRQIAKGFSGMHDDQHANGELVTFALLLGSHYTQITGAAYPPWVDDSVSHAMDRHASNPRQMLVICAALLQAEIERIDRLAENRDPS